MIYNKITLTYDGSHFSGWQIQPNGLTIQEVLQDVLKKLTGDNIHVTASGRTDAGVHALAQVAHFATKKPVTAHAINALLPPEIRILSLEETTKDFHARFSAKGKIYHYFLHLDPILSPFDRKYRTHCTYPLSIPLMEKAAKRFLGTHDFTSFANVGGSSKEMIKTLYRLELVPIDGGLRFEFHGNGFLYKMVRNIVGTLIDLGRGNLDLSDLDRIFDGRDRRLSGRAAPPEGLFLVNVEY